jgi:hypothetical protein
VVIYVSFATKTRSVLPEHNQWQNGLPVKLSYSQDPVPRHPGGPLVVVERDQMPAALRDFDPVYVGLGSKNEPATRERAAREGRSEWQRRSDQLNRVR